MGQQVTLEHLNQQQQHQQNLENLEEHLEDSAVKDLEDVEVKDLVDLNLNLDPEDGTLLF